MIELLRLKKASHASKIFVLFVLMLIGSLTVPLIGHAAANEYGPDVYHLELHGDVDTVMVQYVERGLKAAKEASAEHLILSLNTFGGRVDSASEIGELLMNSTIPITAYVEEKAVSAGTYIALHADQIVMKDGSVIGSAAVVEGSGKLVDNPKTISFWVEKMSEAAKLHGRDPNIAIAMVDPRIEVDLTESLGKVKQPGDVIAISASEALAAGYAEYNVTSFDELIEVLGFTNRSITLVDISPAEQFAKFLLHPVVSAILLIIGFAGIGIELFVPGFGIPGILGISSMGLYFLGSYLGGLAGMEVVVLFVVGFILVILELFVPAFGILGILGGGAIITGIILASPDVETAVYSIIVALVVAILLIIVFSRTRKGKAIWSKFVLREKLTTEEGFISAESKNDLVGKTGVTITALRPAGSATIDNVRVDVVTEGGFVEKNRPVVVVKAEGTWVVVREVTN